MINYILVRSIMSGVINIASFVFAMMYLLQMRPFAACFAVIGLSGLAALVRPSAEDEERLNEHLNKWEE